MDFYEIFSLILCVFAVFGGYIALRIASRAVLRHFSRRNGCETDGCGTCASASVCPEKRTDDPEAAKRD